MERKKRELSEEIRKKTIAKHGQGKGYETISKQIHLLILLRSFRVHGTVAPGCGHKKKNYSGLSRRIVPVLEKGKTSKQVQADPTVQQCPVTPYIAFWMTVASMEVTSVLCSQKKNKAFKLKSIITHGETLRMFRYAEGWFCLHSVLWICAGQN